MQLGLGLGLSSKLAGGAVNAAPVDIAWAGSHTVAEDAVFGTMIGGVLSATDPEGDVVTFSIPDATSKFAISGTSIIVAGVLDFEADASHDVVIRATDAIGNSFDEQFTITVSDVAEGGADSDAPPDDGAIEEDGEFDIPPTVTITSSGDIKIHGKKASGKVGKIIYDLGPAVAGRKYSMQYEADFSLLSDFGKNEMVGFVLKDGNEFAFIGQRGDGLTGLDTLEVYGSPPDGGWQQGTGFTDNIAGDSQNGTQEGPNWQQIEFAANGSTYDFRTSGDDGDTFDTEFDDEAPEPFADVADASQFGVGIMLAAGVSGPFVITVRVWTEEDSLPDLVAFDFIGAMARLSADLTGSPVANTDTAISFNTQVEDTTAIFAPTSTKMIIPVGLNGRLCILFGVSWVEYTSVAGVDFSLSIRKNGSATFDGGCQHTATTIYNTLLRATVQTQPIVVATGDEFEFYHMNDQNGNTESDWTAFGIWVVA